MNVDTTLHYGMPLYYVLCMYGICTAIMYVCMYAWYMYYENLKKYKLVTQAYIHT